ncbi:MAG: hypothetical protein JXA30_10835 [Deltaproteobacteria bacterium]|nr:hypothetical protein [Deltaproteobacteria bacterium]
MVLAVPDEPARGRKPVLRDGSAAVVAKQQYPPEQLLRTGIAANRHGPKSPRASRLHAIDFRNKG